MKKMKIVLMLSLFCGALTLPTFGCADGVAHTKADYARSTRRAFRYDWQMAVDDFHLITYTRRPLRLSHYVVD